MKKHDLVCLLNNENLEQCGIQKNDSGVILSLNNNIAEVMFLSDKNYGDCAFANVRENDLKVIGQLEDNLISELEEFLENTNKDKHRAYKEIKIKEYDKVELLVEDIKYSQYGVHKGAVGCVIQDYLIKNEVMVDFSSVDENGNLIGDTIVVSVEDLKVI